MQSYLVFQLSETFFIGELGVEALMSLGKVRLRLSSVLVIRIPVGPHIDLAVTQD